MIVFSKTEVRKFEDWTVAHLHKFFPKECAAAGEHKLLGLVQHGIVRAKAHGITSKADVVKYIDLMVVFGRDFDTDRRQRWAANVLKQRRHSSITMRMLLQAAKARLNRR